uniref:Uncharacterized protein n=1 Tax=viral metagenome TaxID=1070528 RepID=A0A6H2A2X5_9ZZZZ
MKGFEKKLLWVEKKNQMGSCWRFEFSYPVISGVTLHQAWAGGTGEVVRHLCGCSRCVNPLHLIRGNDIENAMDEIVVRDWSIKWFEEKMEDYSLREYEKDLQFKVLVARAALKLKGAYGFKRLDDVIQLAREEFRKDFVRQFKIEEFNEINVIIAKEAFKWLVRNWKIELIMY